MHILHDPESGLNEVGELRGARGGHRHLPPKILCRRAPYGHRPFPQKGSHLALCFGSRLPLAAQNFRQVPLANLGQALQVILGQTIAFDDRQNLLNQRRQIGGYFLHKMHQNT